MLITRRFLSKYISWFISYLGFAKSACITYAVGYASLLNWSLIRWGLTRSNAVSQGSSPASTALFLLLCSNGRGTQPVRARVQARGSILVLARRPSSADVFTAPWPPQSAFFIISLPHGWLSLISPSLWSNSHWEPFNDVCCDHIHWTRRLFCSRFLSDLCFDSSPVLSDIHVSWLICLHRCTHTLRFIGFLIFPDPHCFVLSVSIHSHTSWSQF